VKLVLLLTSNLAECKDFAIQMFVFAKRAAPFKGKNVPLHYFGARNVIVWCSSMLRAVHRPQAQHFVGF
jgi:hypothetical protein